MKRRAKLIGAERKVKLVAKKRKKSKAVQPRYYLSENEKLQLVAELEAGKLGNTREVEDAMYREIAQIDFLHAAIVAGRQHDWIGDFIIDEVDRIELLCKARIATSKWPAYAHFD